MKITRVTARPHEILPKHKSRHQNDYRNQLLASFSIELDGELVIHGIKLIQGREGTFLCMPTEMKTDRCPNCNIKTPILANYCSRCGEELERGRKRFLKADEQGRVKVDLDVVHPVVNSFREQMFQACLEEYYWIQKEYEERGYEERRHEEEKKVEEGRKPGSSGVGSSGVGYRGEEKAC